MSRDLRPLAPEDIPELGRFLAAGFHAAPDADFAAPDVLRWKYLGTAPATPVVSSTSADESIVAGPDAPRSYIATDEAGRIVGHLGLCRTAFEGKALATAGGRVSTIHIIDWLGSPEHKAVGMSLMRRAHQRVATQFGLGVSPSALAVGERAGYDLRSLVPVYTRVLRAGYWLRAEGLGPWRRGLGIARDAMNRSIRPPIDPEMIIQAHRVVRFGPEIAPIVEAAGESAIMTTRDPSRLNTFLDFPRQSMSGWHLRDGLGALRGFALLNVIPGDGGRTRTGKVVDCLLDDTHGPHWHAAFAALTRELGRQGADLVQAYASTPWAVDALGSCGFTSRFRVKFHVRDRQGLIPREATFHLTPMEGDYAYT